MTSSRVGVTLETRSAKGPASDSSTKGGCEVRKLHLARALVASLGRRLRTANGRSLGGGQGARQANQSGASKPQSHKCWRAKTAAVAQGLPLLRTAPLTVSNGRRAGLDDGERVAPGGPVSGVTVRAGATPA